MSMPISTLRGVVFALFFSLLSCDGSRPDPRMEDLKKDINKSLQDVRRFFSDHTPSTNEVTQKTSTELNKLFAFEYRVIEIPADMPPIEVEKRLNGAGQERWECFNSCKSEGHVRFYCKRRPESYLRYIPRFFP